MEDGTIDLSEGYLQPSGDIGSIECAEEIAAFKPLRAVYGNIDNSTVRYHYGEFLSFQCEDVTVLMTHIGGYPRHYHPKALQKIQSTKPKIFISGHSHILKVIYDNIYDLLHLTPGAAGCGNQGNDEIA